MLNHKGNLKGKEAPLLTHLARLQIKISHRLKKMSVFGAAQKNIKRKTAHSSWNI